MRFIYLPLALTVLLSASPLSAQKANKAAPKRLTELAAACASGQAPTGKKAAKAGKSAQSLNAKRCQALLKRGLIDKNGKIDSSRIKSLRKAVHKGRAGKASKAARHGKAKKAIRGGSSRSGR